MFFKRSVSESLQVALLTVVCYAHIACYFCLVFYEEKGVEIKFDNSSVFAFVILVRPTSASATSHQIAMTSWQTYVDDYLVGTGLVEKAAVISSDRVWAKSPNLEVHAHFSLSTLCLGRVPILRAPFAGRKNVFFFVFFFPQVEIFPSLLFLHVFVILVNRGRVGRAVESL
jgi:hypothetical protein